MKKCIIGKKIGMTQLFDENGNIVPVTVVEAGPCVVVQRKTTESDGYEAVQIGFGAVSDKKLTKALKGHFAKADVAAKRVLREFRLEDLSAITVGDIIDALEGPLTISDCVGDERCCHKSESCASRRVWTYLSQSINDLLQSITLQDMLNQENFDPDPISRN